MKRLVVAMIAFALVSPAAGQAPSAEAPTLPPGYWSLDKSAPLLARTGTVRLTADLAGLGAGERAAVAKLLQAGAIMQELYERQQHPQAAAAYADLVALDRRLGSPAATGNLKKLYRMNSGPIAETLENEREAFLPVAPVQPGKTLYPAGIKKDEIEAWLAAHPSDRAAILAPRSVVRHATPEHLQADLATLTRHPALATLHYGLRERLQRRAAAPADLYAVPYAVAYADDIMRVHALLNEAAVAVEAEDADFAGFLRHRARDLLSDDYEAGDAAWVTGRFRNLNAQIGSYEPYSDELYGTKTFMGLSLLRLRGPETAKLREALKGLQAFEDSLPYAPHKRVRDDIPAGIYDVIADFGDARGGNTATILPNDAELARRYGRTVLLRANILTNARIFENYRPAWQAAMAPAHHAELTPDGEFFNTVWHEIGHYLGVDRTRDGRTLDAALQANASTLEELKADLVSLYLGEALRARGYYGDDQLRAHYASGIFRALVEHKPRRDQTYGTMRLIQCNVFLQHGVLSFDSATRTLAIRYERYREVVGKLLAEVLALQQAGDADAADAFIARHTSWDEALHGVIGKKMRAAAPYEFWGFEYAALESTP